MVVNKATTPTGLDTCTDDPTGHHSIKLRGGGGCVTLTELQAVAQQRGLTGFDTRVYAKRVTCRSLTRLWLTGLDARPWCTLRSERIHTRILPSFDDVAFVISLCSITTALQVKRIDRLTLSSCMSASKGGL